MIVALADLMLGVDVAASSSVTGDFRWKAAFTSMSGVADMPKQGDSLLVLHCCSSSGFQLRQSCFSCVIMYAWIVVSFVIVAIAEGLMALNTVYTSGMSAIFSDALWQQAMKHT